MKYHIVKLDAVASDDGCSIRYLADQPYLVTSSRYSAADACFSCSARNKAQAWIKFVNRVKR